MLICTIKSYLEWFGVGFVVGFFTLPVGMFIYTAWTARCSKHQEVK